MEKIPKSTHRQEKRSINEISACQKHDIRWATRSYLHSISGSNIRQYSLYFQVIKPILQSNIPYIEKQFTLYYFSHTALQQQKKRRFKDSQSLETPHPRLLETGNRRLKTGVHHPKHPTLQMPNTLQKAFSHEKARLNRMRANKVASQQKMQAFVFSRLQNLAFCPLMRTFARN